MSTTEVIDDVLRYRKTLEDDTVPEQEVQSVLDLLDDLEVDRALLAKTKIGVTVAKIKKSENAEIAAKAKKLVEKWKSTIAADNKPSSQKSSTPPTQQRAGAVTLSTTYNGPSCGDVKRDKAREILFKAFIDGLPAEQLAEIDRGTAERLSAAMEDSLYTHFVEASGNQRSYQAQLRAIKSNLADKKNVDFNLRLYIGAIPMEKLPTMQSTEMASDAKKAERQKAKKDALEACQSDWDLRNVKRTAGQFPCGKCKSANTTYFQMQTRSSDEPMTTFVNCLNCGNRWKF